MTQTPIIFLSIRRIFIILYVFLLLHSMAFSCQAKAAFDQDFPNYKAIRNNVAFWEKIYSHYSLTEAVIHDSEDLSKIYEIIPLLSDDLPGAARLNSLFQKRTQEKYSTILKKLAIGKPATKDEIRVAALFSEKNKRKEFLSASDNVRSQRGQKERFLAGVIHSGRYLTEIKRIFRSYSLPEELAYLPHVESSFNFKAYSKFGAAGIWQIIRSTGKQYLTIDYTLDERLDPILATHAAAKYLKNSYSTLHNWPLALTSYNYGLAGMLRAANDEGSYEKVFTNYNKGHFKFASKNFYSEFLAAVKVARQLENNPKVKIDPSLSTRYLTLSGYLHIKDAGSHFGVPQETIISLNPGLLSPVVNGEKHIPKGYTLRLPAEKNTNRLLASIPSSLYKKEQKPSLFHHVRKGDTAGSIARLHGISLKSLMNANNLDQYATIYLNQKLRIPKTGKKVAAAEKNSPRLSHSVTNVSISNDRPIISLLASKKKHPSGSGFDFLPMKDPTVYNVFNIYKKNGKTYGYITVQPEESIGLYCSWLGIAESSLSALNKLVPKEPIDPGQQLLLVFDRLSPTLFEEKRLDFFRATEKDFFAAFTVIGKKIYQVISGDTLWDICYNKFDIPLWLLKRYNSTMSLAKLDKKQELIIPIIEQI